MRPVLGELTLLVYRECPCGQWLATGEAASAPICPSCNGRFVPGGGAPLRDGVPQFGSDSNECRRMRALGFAALFTTERAAVRLSTRVRRWLGLADEWGLTDERFRREGKEDPYFTEQERVGGSDEIVRAMALPPSDG